MLFVYVVFAINSLLPVVEKEETVLGCDDEFEDASAVMISDKMRPPRMYDPIPQRDPGYYASSGNLKLKEVGISPIPDLYKNRDGVFGGTSTPMPPGPTTGFRSKIRPTGKNWHKVDFIDDPEENSETFSLSDIADELLREYIRTTLMEIK